MRDDLKIPAEEICFREVRSQLELTLSNLVRVVLLQRFGEQLVRTFLWRETPPEHLLGDLDSNRAMRSLVRELQRFTIEVESCKFYMDRESAPEIGQDDACHAQRDRDFGKSV